MRRVPTLATVTLTLALAFVLWRTPPRPAEVVERADADPPPVSDLAAIPGSEESFDRELSEPRTLPPLVEEPSPEPAGSDDRVAFRRVLSPTSFIANVAGQDRTITLAALRAPSECGPQHGTFDAEAVRYLESLLAGAELELKPLAGGTEKYSVYLNPKGPVFGREAAAVMLRNGYGCVDEGTLPAICPLGYPHAEKLARSRQRGIWRDGSALTKGYVSEADNSLIALRSLAEARMK